MSTEPMLNIALRAARKAGDIILQGMERIDRLKVEAKSTNDFVTNIDQKAEKTILYHLSRAYPDHSFRAEESGFVEGEDPDYEWVIDPLDGTTNYIHGIPHFAVSIACKFKGRVIHAVVYDPVKREEFTASAGHGAMLNNRRIRVSPRMGLDGALIGTGIPFSGFALENMTAYLSCLEDIASKTAGIRRPGSAALDLAYVAAGRFDGFWEMNLKEWDIAAGTLLVKEAGGLLGDFQGGDQYLSSGHVVCGNPKVFKHLVTMVNKHLGHLS